MGTTVEMMDEGEGSRSMKPVIQRMIGYNLLPITRKDGVWTFSIFSRATMLCTMILGGPSFLFAGLFIADLSLYPEKFANILDQTVLDTFSILLVISCLVFSPLYPPPLAKALTVLEPCCPATWPGPKGRFRLGLVCLLLIIFNICFLIPLYIVWLRKSDDASWTLTVVHLSFAIVTLFIGNALFFMLANIILGWLATFSRLCRRVPDKARSASASPSGLYRAPSSSLGESQLRSRSKHSVQEGEEDTAFTVQEQSPNRTQIVADTNTALAIYEKIGEVYGTLCLMMFPGVQVFLVIWLYMAAKDYISYDQQRIDRDYGGNGLYVVYLVGLVGLPLAFFLFVYVITDTLAKATEALKSRVAIIEDCLREVKGERERLDLESLIRKLGEVGPITARDFFTVERTTITSMIETTVTYLIILVQVKQSESTDSPAVSTTAPVTSTSSAI